MKDLFKDVKPLTEAEVLANISTAVKLAQQQSRELYQRPQTAEEFEAEYRANAKKLAAAVNPPFEPKKMLVFMGLSTGKKKRTKKK